MLFRSKIILPAVLADLLFLERKSRQKELSHATDNLQTGRLCDRNQHFICLEEPILRNYFREQLKQLHQELTEMGKTCEMAISAASEALLKNNDALAAAAENAEEELDRQEREVEDLCLKLLLRQQPVARDLRQISAALKMISDLERIGDQAADIAELARFIRVPVENLHIAEMTQAVIRMVTDSVNAFVQRDLELARAVCAADDQVDALFDQVKQELVELIASNAANSGQSLDLLMVAMYL